MTSPDLNNSVTSLHRHNSVTSLRLLLAIEASAGGSKPSVSGEDDVLPSALQGVHDGDAQVSVEPCVHEHVHAGVQHQDESQGSHDPVAHGVGEGGHELRDHVRGAAHEEQAEHAEEHLEVLDEAKAGSRLAGLGARSR